MERTIEQEKEYNELPEHLRVDYDFEQRLHPDFSHEQLCKMVSIKVFHAHVPTDRTPEQEKEYKNFSKKYQDYYDFEQRQHPDFSHEQLCKMVAIKMQIDDVFNHGGPTGPIGPKPIGEILKKAADYIKKDLPRVWVNVKGAFERAIDYLQDLIRRGVQLVMEKLLEILYGPTY